MSKEHPILFSAPMVRAILAGQKSQTRRVVKGLQLPKQMEDGTWFAVAQHDPRYGFGVSGNTEQECAAELSVFGICPYGGPGDRLWVRETWATDDSLNDKAPSGFSAWPVRYLADGAQRACGAFHGNTKGKTRVSIHMPRWASRILLEIVSVRVERLNDCSEGDAIAEGLTSLSKDGDRTFKYGIPDADGLPGNDNTGWHWQDWQRDPREAYAHLWEQINGPDSWTANPWVWVVEFKRIDA